MTQSIDELKKNPTFCSMAWNHQFLDPTGRVKPCCRFAEKYRPSDINLHNDSLSNIFYGDWMSEVREKMLKGEKIEGCRRCYEEEDNGKKSLRQRYNDNQMLPIKELVDIEAPKIRWLELAISNACNLACRMCDSRYSLKWFDEELEHWGKTHSPKKVTSTDITSIDPFIKDLVHIKFTGGEPLITKEHWQTIDKLLAQSDCSKIFINYSTNCTIYPKEEWVEKWNRFKRIEFALSFDSADKAESEYIRWPAKFDTTEETTKAFIELGKGDNYQIILRSTVSLLNIYHLPETILWWFKEVGDNSVSINPTHLTYPEFLSITVLPKHLKEKVAEKFRPFIEGDYPKNMKNSLQHMLTYMNSKDQSQLLPELHDYTIKTDCFRGQSFFESYPFFADIFEGVKARVSDH